LFSRTGTAPHHDSKRTLITVEIATPIGMVWPAWTAVLAALLAVAFGVVAAVFRALQHLPRLEKVRIAAAGGGGSALGSDAQQKIRYQATSLRFGNGLALAAAAESELLLATLETPPSNPSTQPTTSAQGTIGFFHPFADGGGGGERVLWCVCEAAVLLTAHVLNPQLQTSGCLPHSRQPAQQQQQRLIDHSPVPPPLLPGPKQTHHAQPCTLWTPGWACARCRRPPPQ